MNRSIDREMSERVKVCPACEGRGTVSQRDESADGSEVYVDTTCPRCQGTGESD